MTIRKLAKALGVTPRQLSPQQFDQGAASEIFSQESLVKPETANTSVSEAAASRFVDVESTVAYVRYAVEAVRTQSGLEAQNPSVNKPAARQYNSDKCFIVIFGCSPSVKRVGA